MKHWIYYQRLSYYLYKIFEMDFFFAVHTQTLQTVLHAKQRPQEGPISI